MKSLFETLNRLEEPVDLILYAGDDISRFEEEGRNILSELAEETRLGKVLAVMGNDDLPHSQEILESEGVHDLHQEPFVYRDYVFLGQEGAIEGEPGLILHSEEEIQQHLEDQYGGFKDEIPVLVSHVPPNGILDIGQRFGQSHIGSQSVRKFINAESPALTVCGHCHQFGGRAENGDFGTVINIASHDDPGAKGRYGVVELDGRKVNYTLTTTEEGADHDLLQLSQVGGRRIRHFIDAGITELDDINGENREKLLDLPGSSDWHVDMWLEEAKAIRNDELRVRDPGEFEFLNDDNVVLLDIETDLKQDHIWLIGLYSYQDDEYTNIFEKDDEEALLKSLIQYLRSQGEPSIIYHGNNRFDEKCLKHRMRTHGLQAGVTLMGNSHDLGIQIQNHLLGKFNRTNLSALSRQIADYEYKHPEIDGFLVGKQYTEYLLDGKEPDWNKLLEYNKDDVLALKTVVDRIKSIIR